MTVVRALLALAGVTAIVLGLRDLLDEGGGDVVAATWWLLGGVLAHDALLAPLVIGVGLVAVRVVPGWARSAVIAAGVVVGSVTLLAVPVLGRFGARADNPTLLDRDYTAGWLAFVAGVVGAAALWSLLVSRPRMTRSRS